MERVILLDEGGYGDQTCRLSSMNKYGSVAELAAVRAFKESLEPREAWKIESELAFPDAPAAATKNCPLSTFLGLCSDGLVVGIPAGEYTDSKENRAYGARAVELVRKRPELLDDLQQLWVESTDPGRLVPNSQMDVVAGLAKAGMLKVVR
jgi:Family of unknown function (DUF6979)